MLSHFCKKKILSFADCSGFGPLISLSWCWYWVRLSWWWPVCVQGRGEALGVHLIDGHTAGICRSRVGTSALLAQAVPSESFGHFFQLSLPLAFAECRPIDSAGSPCGPLTQGSPTCLHHRAALPLHSGNPDVCACPSDPPSLSLLPTVPWPQKREHFSYKISFPPCPHG